MPSYVILLRAVNVGGTGKLPMADLKAMAEAAGLKAVRTYIASGNLVAESKDSAEKIKATMEKKLQAYAGKPVGVIVRSAAEMAQVLAKNPFAKGAGNRVLAIFLDEPPPADALKSVTHQVDEKIALGKREIYVHYGEGMGQSKLKIPAAKAGTARNMNTVAKLAEMAAEKK